MNTQLVTIIPDVPMGEGARRTQGTKVLLPDGRHLPGVTRIVITCDTNNVWRATIDCLANVPAFDGVEAEVRVEARWRRWLRVVQRWLGRDVEVTTLDSTAREYV